MLTYISPRLPKLKQTEAKSFGSLNMLCALLLYASYADADRAIPKKSYGDAISPFAAVAGSGDCA